MDEVARKPIPIAARGGAFSEPRPAPPRPPAGPYARVPPSALRPLASMPAGAPLAAGIGARALPMPRSTFGLPNLRRNVCAHFYITSARGAIPIHAPHLLKALMRQEGNVSRCQLRGGVHLEHGYVADICFSARFNQCVFYEDELTSR